MTHRPRQQRYAALLVTGAAAALILVSLGSAKNVAATAQGAQEPQVAEARRLVAQDRLPRKWMRPGPPLAVGTQVQGKTLFYIANGLNLPFTQALVAGVKEAADLVGMTVVVTDGAGQASEAARLIEQAIGRKADVIVLQAFPSSALTAPIRAAKQAGIPVIIEFEQDPTLPPPPERALGVRAIVGFCYGCAGRSIARWIVADSNGDANVVHVTSTNFGLIAKQFTGAFTSEMKRLCPQCNVTVKDLPLAQWQTGLGPLTSSALKADPSVNYLFPLVDGMVAPMKPAVFALNAEDRVKIISYNADLPNLQAIKKGNDPEVANVGGPQHWAGWAAVDQVLRILLGRRPVADEHIPNRLFDARNINSIDLKKDESNWFGNIDFRARYKALWGYK